MGKTNCDKHRVIAVVVGQTTKHVSFNEYDIRFVGRL